MRLSDLLNEISVPDTYKDASKHLINHGYNFVGDGSYARVVGKDAQPFVVKIFSKNDTAYISYLKLISAIKNEHFPIIYGKPRLVKDSYYGVKIERLTEIRKFAESGLSLLIEQFIYDLEGPMKISKLPETHPSLAEALLLIYSHIVKPRLGHFDIHDGNVMMRGSTIVFSDPVII